MIEWITLFFAIILEATSVTWPGKDLRDRLPFLKQRSVWALLIAVPMFLLSISYLLFSFVWAVSEVPPIRVCGGVILIISLIELFGMVSKRPKSVFLKRIDGAVCFVCLVLIGYAKTKGW